MIAKFSTRSDGYSEAKPIMYFAYCNIRWILQLVNIIPKSCKI